MGLGRFKDGKFDLVLSIRHAADATRIQQWERSFRRASEVLYDSTDGQMQFGCLYVANDSRGSDEADGWLLEEEGTSSSSVNALGTAGLHMNLKSDEKNKPFVIIHEFGHYGLGVYDEYKGPDGAAECIGGTTASACIMESGWWDGDQISDGGVLTNGRVNEFCVSSNHDSDGDTFQEERNDKACWETIKDNYPNINVPLDLPTEPEPAGHDPVKWVLLADDPRFVLCLDKSGSMAANNAIAGVRFGADYWVNALAQGGDSLSVLAYNQDVQKVLPLTLLNDSTDLTPILAAIMSITPSGNTNIGGALDEGHSQITSGGDRAATQVMILFSDGLHNTGTPPEDVIPKLISDGIRVYTIGFGPAADQVRLQKIAEDTGGRFEQIDAPGGTGDAQLDIQNALIEISGEVRDGTGIVTTIPGLLPEPTNEAEVNEFSEVQAAVSDYAKMSKVPVCFRCRPSGFAHRVFIERGSKKATFAASYTPAGPLAFFLIRPNRSVVNPQADADVVFVNPKDSPYALYIVSDPDPGPWIMRVFRKRREGAVPFKLFAFSENRDLTLGVDGFRRTYQVNESVRLRLSATYKVPLTGLLTPIARVFSNDGKLVKSVCLKERRIRHHGPGGKWHNPYTSVRNGVYEGSFKLGESGAFTVEVRAVNIGRARPASEVAERTRRGDPIDRFERPPIFVRTRRFQIHVGSLPKGRDLDPIIT